MTKVGKCVLIVFILALVVFLGWNMKKAQQACDRSDQTIARADAAIRMSEESMRRHRNGW